MVVFSSCSRKGIPTGGMFGQAKLVICDWPNTGQRVANGTIPLQPRARNSTKHVNIDEQGQGWLD